MLIFNYFDASSGMCSQNANCKACNFGCCSVSGWCGCGDTYCKNQYNWQPDNHIYSFEKD